MPSYSLVLMLLVAFLSYLGVAFADTEVIILDAGSSANAVIPQASQWLTVGPASPQHTLLEQPAPLGMRLSDVCERKNRTMPGPCLYEIWVLLDLDSFEWHTFAKFTLRISWPANHPTQFLLETYTPHQVHNLLKGPRHVDAGVLQHGISTRNLYARIRLVDTGVRTPPATDVPAEPVPFILLLEPFYFGVIPKSLIPTLSFITLVTLVAIFAVAPLVNQRLADVVAQAKYEELTRSTRKAQKKMS